MISHSTFTECRDKLVKLSERLADITPERKADIASALAHLLNNRFEIGVIGQIKAGKSTFLNALMEKPGFLPVDVNPWTAVITRLCFGENHEPSGTAIFRFFTADEWVQITEKPGVKAERKEITDRPLHQSGSQLSRLLGGVFDIFNTKPDERESSVVRPQQEQDEREGGRLEAERKTIIDRVRHRFGSELPKLLGTEKRYEQVTRGILEQFLASGEFSDPSRPEAGKYSDVTREAEIFFPLEPFAEACTIVDTPGTNDPFKARSAVTLRYLARADAYLLLLHGPQALTSQDIELLNKLLLGLHKERIVVFINRIDNFNDIKGDTESVTRRVRGWLEKHYPESGIQHNVLTGCAFWAERTLKFDARLAQRFLFKDGACDYGVTHRFFTQEQFSTWEKEPESHLDAIKKAMLDCSGLPAARRAIAETLLREKGYALLEGARCNLLAQAEAFAAEAAMMADQLDQDAGVLEDDAIEAQKQLDRLDAEIAAMAESKANLAEARKTGEEELHTVLREALDTLTDQLEESLQDAASREGDRIRLGISIFDSRHWYAEVGEIRGELERVFLRQYQRATYHVQEQQQRFRSLLRRQLLAVADLGTVEIDAVLVAPIDPRPSLEALAQECTVDLGGFFSRLFAGRDTAEEKAKALEEAVINGFEPACAGLIEAAREALMEAVAATIETCGAAVKRGFAQIEGDVNRRRQVYSARIKEKDPNAIKKQVEETRARSARQRDLGIKLGALAEEIRTFQVSKQHRET